MRRARRGIDVLFHPIMVLPVSIRRLMRIREALGLPGRCRPRPRT